MHTEKVRPHTSNASRNPGREAVRQNGERHYINHRPHFSVHFYPADKTRSLEEVWYREWQDGFICYGYNLLPIYDQLKANGWEVLQESPGPNNPADGRPFITKIEYRMDI